MVHFPVNVGLTIAFAITGFYCLIHLISSRFGVAARHTRSLTDDEVVDVDHVIMSLAMVVMTWLMVDDVLLWAQVALFAVLTLSFLPNMKRARGTAARVDISGHMLLNLAMIWMLAAMPLLMAGMDHGTSSGGAGHGSHGGGDTEGALVATPGWVDGVNAGFIAVCGVAAVWWIARVAVSKGRHRWHSGCHALMAAAMAVMLKVMNG